MGNSTLENTLNGNLQAAQQNRIRRHGKPGPTSLTMAQAWHSVGPGTRAPGFAWAVNCEENNVWMSRPAPRSSPANYTCAVYVRRPFLHRNVDRPVHSDGVFYLLEQLLSPT